MANPRQRRKARSSTHKPVSHSRHAQKNLKKMPHIRAPKILQDSWDKKKTVKQNYEALGLIHNLNPAPAGGVERLDQIYNNVLSKPSTTSSDISIPVGYGRIIRDEAGSVLRIELPQNEDSEISEEQKERDKLEPVLDEMLVETWATNIGKSACSTQTADYGKSVVEQLERISATKNSSTTISASISGVGPRHASAGEIVSLERLVKKYGKDVEQMARDRKLNAEQRTGGQLRRALIRAGF